MKILSVRCIKTGIALGASLSALTACSAFQATHTPDFYCPIPSELQRAAERPPKPPIETMEDPVDMFRALAQFSVQQEGALNVSEFRANALVQAVEVCNHGRHSKRQGSSLPKAN